MANRTLPMTDALHAYLVDVSVDEHPVLAELRSETAARDNAVMQIGPEQGAFMAWIVKLIGARRGVEVGTFTGYSALAVALAMPEDGALVCCDLSAEYLSTARTFWERAGVADKVESRVGPAGESLDALLAEGGAGTFDYAFIDADKPRYDRYYEACLELLRPGGVMMIDNVLWGGAVIRPEDESDATVALRALNEKVGRDARIDASMVPIGDGLFMVRKR
ncbi:MAG: class I SAM-dependent methyltransferase [Sandaracinaceae bacterium]